ncbi:MAG: hypothetical protein OEW67_02315 [Cyclobacteriaceae bacterium]|nr:hypothetical protein [Cyclobacteriaceae bacterium]
MTCLLILSEHENESQYWEFFTNKMPSVASNELSVSYCPELIVDKNKQNSESKQWLKNVAKSASKFGIHIQVDLDKVDTMQMLKKKTQSSQCTIMSHEILQQINKKPIFSSLHSPLISIPDSFHFIEKCIILFDKKVESINNFKKFFNQFTSALSSIEVILLIEMGKTINDALKNKMAVEYVVSSLKNVGVITFKKSHMKDEVLKYVLEAESSALVFHKSNYTTLIDSNFINETQNKKITYYLDEF